MKTSKFVITNFLNYTIFFIFLTPILLTLLSSLFLTSCCASSTYSTMYFFALLLAAPNGYRYRQHMTYDQFVAELYHTLRYLRDRDRLDDGVAETVDAVLDCYEEYYYSHIAPLLPL